MRVVGRHETRLSAAFAQVAIETVAADLETAEGAAKAVQGVDTVVFTVGLPYTEFRRYPGLMKTVIDACEKAGVGRFLLVSNVYPYGLPQTELVTETHPMNPVAFKGRMRLEQLRAVQNSRMQWIVLHLPDFYGPEAELSYAHMICEAASQKKPANLFTPSDTPHQFVYTPDVGPVVADLLARDTGWNESYNFAGSGIITVEQFARKVYQAAGQPFRHRNVAPWMLRLLGFFQPIMGEFVEMHYLQSTPVNISDEKLVRHLGSVRRTSYEDGIPSMFAAYSR